MADLKFPRINSVIISGRLTQDVDLRYTANGTPVIRLPIASSRVYLKDGEWQEDTSFFDVVAWSKLAERCANTLHKGSPIIVEGMLQARTFTDKDNQNRKVTEIVAQRISFLEKQAQSNTGDKDFDENTDNVTTEDDVPF